MFSLTKLPCWPLAKASLVPFHSLLPFSWSLNHQCVSTLYCPRWNCFALFSSSSSSVSTVKYWPSKRPLAGQNTHTHTKCPRSSFGHGHFQFCCAAMKNTWRPWPWWLTERRREQKALLLFCGSLLQVPEIWRKYLHKIDQKDKRLKEGERLERWYAVHCLHSCFLFIFPFNCCAFHPGLFVSNGEDNVTIMPFCCFLWW